MRKGRRSAAAGETPIKARTPRAARLSPEARRASIVAQAIKQTAASGFAWQTRDLAKSLRVAQASIFRYFPKKETLISAVFEEVYLKRWKPMWELMLTDRSVFIERRLFAFYESYAATIFDYEWIRIYLYSGLMGYDLNRRYVQLLESKILANICKEIRAAKGHADRESNATARDMEIAWQIHAGLFYYGVRKFIYNIPVLPNTEAVIANTVRMLMTEIPFKAQSD